MKLTSTQFATLRWLSDVGGSAVCRGEKLVSQQYLEREASRKKGHHTAVNLGVHERKMPAVSALHLVQAGCIEARDGKLHITDKGRAYLAPFGRAA